MKNAAAIEREFDCRFFCFVKNTHHVFLGLKPKATKSVVATRLVRNFDLKIRITFSLG